MSKAGACISFQKNDDHKMEFSKFVGIVAVFHKKLTDVIPELFMLV